MKTYIIRGLNAIAQGVAYGYSGLLIAYFILRIIFWDRFWIVAFFGGLIPWLLFPILLLPFIGIFQVKKRWFSISSSIAALILIGWLHSHYFSPDLSNQRRINADSLNVKVLSLNATWHHTTKEALADLILRENPDIICLQETIRENTHGLWPSIETRYPDKYFSPGLAMFSRYPIAAKEKFQLANHHEFQQRVLLTINQQPVVLYNMQTTAPWIHPQKILPGLKMPVYLPVYQYSDRTEQIQEFIERLQTETLPVIAAGDFNFTDQSQDYSLVASRMKDAFKVSGFGFGFTWPHGWPLRDLIKITNWKLTVPLFRLDYVWYSPHWQSNHSQVLPPVGSEHLPTSTKLTLISEFKSAQSEDYSGS